MNIKAPLNTLLGYGAASWNIAKALHELGEPIALFPIGDPYLTTDDRDLVVQLINNRFNAFDINQPSITIFHEYLLYDALQSRSRVIGFPFFEIDQMDLPRVKSLECVDTLFTTSQWGKDILEQHVKCQIDIVPLGVDINIFKPKPRTQKDSGPYKFFSIGKIEKRKCTELLPSIFDHAFSPKDDVELHIMCDSPLPQIKQQMPYLRELFNSSPMGGKIFIHSIKATDYDLAHFIQSMDCGIFMTRAEGWGLPILQSLACGKPIIVTDYSAQSEFCNNSNSLIVNITKKEPAYDGVWFNGFGQWAAIEEPQLDQCIEHMRHAYNNRLGLNIDGVKTAEGLTWRNTANEILRRCR